MKHDALRRRFLRTAASGTLASIGDVAFLSVLPPVSAAETKLPPQAVRFDPEVEPLVRLLEETPRNRLLEEVAARIKKGLSYRNLLAALLLAGVRNVQPRPSVGFKFHAVLVVNSAHLASLSSPPEHRWLPIFWALDYFKSAQAPDEREGDWTMGPLDEAAIPKASKAKKAFITAMENWDEAAADAAVAGLARTTGAKEVFELFFRYGARDYRSIGHKAIFVANSWRTLQRIGWRHAEPVLRSLAYALLNYVGETNPSKSDHSADRPWRTNAELCQKIRPDWPDGRLDRGATAEMLATLREGSETEAASKVVELINQGVSPQSIWDALLLGSGELLVRRPGIVALHSVTTTNALRFAFQAAASDDTRRRLLLQNASFLPMFRASMGGDGQIGEFQLDKMEPINREAPVSIEEIFRDVSGDRMMAARKVMAYLEKDARPKPLIDAARVLIFLKGYNAHDYKFSSAVLEDFYHVSPWWRNRYLASSVFRLRGSGGSDNRLVRRTREALSG